MVLKIPRRIRTRSVSAREKGRASAAVVVPDDGTGGGASAGAPGAGEVNVVDLVEETDQFGEVLEEDASEFLQPA